MGITLKCNLEVGSPSLSKTYEPNIKTDRISIFHTSLLQPNVNTDTLQCVKNGKNSAIANRLWGCLIPKQNIFYSKI